MCITCNFFFCYSSDSSLPKVQCPNHPDALLVEDYRAGDMICPECGLVVGMMPYDLPPVPKTYSQKWDMSKFFIPFEQIYFFSFSGDRVIDVGSEWRTFSNEKATKDPSRVGDAQNPLLNGGDLTTMISKVMSFTKFMLL